jgi:hypothetical protein
MSAIREFVLHHELFDHHDHHMSYAEFDAQRDSFDYASLLAYAHDDLVTAAAGTRSEIEEPARDLAARYWPKIQATGYARGVALGCQALFGMDYTPENFQAITEALQRAIAGRSAAEVFHHFMHERAQNKWTINDYISDHLSDLGKHSALSPHLFPDSYRCALRVDELFAAVDAVPIEALESFTGTAIYTLGDLERALDLVIDRFLASGKLAAIKIGMVYQRPLKVGEPTRPEAGAAFSRIRSRHSFREAIQQVYGAVEAGTSLALSDHMVHRLLRRAADEDLPVQVHTGYVAGHWRPLAEANVMHLLPLFDRYRRVRFDIFHANWPWTSDLAAVAKNYPNVWIDMCWAWGISPGDSARALSQWLDCVPHNKIFAYGADTGLPWSNVGFSLQAKLGIAKVLEEKIAEDGMSEATAEEIAASIMLRNGEEFYELG